MYLIFSDVCIACMKQNAQLEMWHPLFKGKVCTECEIQIEEIVFQPIGISRVSHI